MRGRGARSTAPVLELPYYGQILKILVNYLLVTSLIARVPIVWPNAISTLFRLQSWAGNNVRMAEYRIEPLNNRRR